MATVKDLKKTIKDYNNKDETDKLIKFRNSLRERINALHYLKKLVIREED